MMTLKITQEQYDECLFIINKTRITTPEVGQMMELFNIYVDAGAKCCGTCPTQVRFIHTRFKSWFSQVEIDEKASELLCRECKAPMYDKRRKFCSVKCREENKKK